MRGLRLHGQRRRFSRATVGVLLLVALMSVIADATTGHSLGRMLTPIVDESASDGH